MNEDIDFFKSVMKREDNANYEEAREFFEKVMAGEQPKEKERENNANYEKAREFFEKVMAGEQPKEKESDSDPDFFITLAMTRDEVVEEVKKDGMFLEKVADRYGDDPEIVTIAVDNNANAYAFASKRLQEDRDLGQFLIGKKNIELKEAESKKDEKGNVDVALIITLQNQIKTINSINRKAIEEKQRSKYHGPELTM